MPHWTLGERTTRCSLGVGRLHRDAPDGGCILVPGECTSSGKHMPRTPSTFRQTDITRALKAVQAAGCTVVRVLIDKAGRIEIATTTGSESAAGEQNEWD